MSAANSGGKDGGAARDQIIEAATTLFVQDGFKATSVKAIADKVGITPPALYWHFSSKQDLFLASMERLLREFVAYVQDNLTATRPYERLEQFVRAHVLWKLEQSDEAGAYTYAVGMRDLMRNLPANHRRTLVSLERLHMSTLRGILQDGANEGVFRVADTRVTAFAILTMCEYVQSWYDPMGELAPDEVAEHYVGLIANMVGNSLKSTSEETI